MNIIIKFLFLCSVHLALPTLMAAQVSVEASLDSVAMFIGQQTDLRINVTAAKGAKIEYPEQIKPGKYLMPGVEVLESLPADTVEKDGLVEISKRFTITSFDENVYVLPKLNVKVDGEDYQTREIALKIVTFEVDTIHPENFYPPKSIIEPRLTFSEVKRMLFSYLFFCLGLVLLFVLYMSLKSNKPIVRIIKRKKRLPPHQKAMEAMEKIKAERLPQSDNQKEYYTRLTDTLRLYIEERFGFSAMEMISTEIISRLNLSANEQTIRELHELFFTADLVKFAKYSTLLNENDMNLVNAIAFIDSTKQEIVEEPKEDSVQLTESELATNRNRMGVKITMAVVALTLTAALAYALYQAYLLFLS